MSEAHKSFFSSGYKKKQKIDNQTLGYMNLIKGSLTKDRIKPGTEPEPLIEPSRNCDVSINVMNDIYEGNEKIEITKGEIIVDGMVKGKMPNTSGCWVKVLKGEKIQNGILTIVRKYDNMKGVN